MMRSKKNKTVFKCSKCGKCCEQLNLSPLFADLHDGSGICKYYNREKKICMIYRHRPVKCNVRLGYNKYKKDKLSYAEYLALNSEYCKKIRGN